MLAVVDFRGVAARRCQESRKCHHGRDHDQAMAVWQTRGCEGRAFADRKWFSDKEERGYLAERRQNSSMIPFISDCPRAQALLPFFMLLNENHISTNAAQPIVNELAGKIPKMTAIPKTATSSFRAGIHKFVDKTWCIGIVLAHTRWLKDIALVSFHTQVWVKGKWCSQENERRQSSSCEFIYKDFDSASTSWPEEFDR